MLREVAAVSLDRDAHWHQHIEEPLRGVDLDDTWAHFIDEFQGNGVIGEVLQGINQKLRIEGNGEIPALIVDSYRLLGFTHFRSIGSDIESILGEIKSHGTAFVTAEQGDTANRLQEGLPFKGDSLLSLSGDDLTVIRISTIHELCGQNRGSKVKGDKIVSDMKPDILVVGEQTLKFSNSLGRHDKIPLMTFRIFDFTEFRITESQAATIGGDQGESPVAKREKNAIEHIARLIEGDCIGGLAQPFLQLGLLHGEPPLFIK